MRNTLDGRRGGGASYVHVAPMAEPMQLVFLVTAFAFNSFGLLSAAKAYRLAWEENRPGEPVYPWFAAAKASAKRIAQKLRLRKRPVNYELVVADGISATAAGRVGVTLQRGVPEEVPDSVRIALLERAIEEVRDEIGQVRQLASQRHSDLSQGLSENAAKIDTESRRLEMLARDAASGGVPLQIRGLRAIGMGTLLAAIPGIWQVVALLTRGA